MENNLSTVDKNSKTENFAELLEESFNKEVKKVKSINRALAVKSAKSWLYNEIDKGCIPKGQKARVVLRVSDPNKECNFYAGFNPKLDANNYLLPEDEKRVLDQSKGAIRLATKSEIKKAGQKVGVITQFITVKKHRDVAAI